MSDVASIAIAVHDFFQCISRKNTDNPCSDKEERDNIASMYIGEASLTSSVTLLALKAPKSSNIVVAITIIGVALAYDGISSIMEYEQKYDTTHRENSKIFWRPVAFIGVTEDIQHLMRKTNDINITVTRAVENLKDLPSNIVAYAVGLGKVVLFEEECHVVPINHLALYGLPMRDCKKVADIKIHSGYSEIDLSSGVKKYGNKLSRVLPNPIKGMTFICLSALTNSIYEKEKEGTSKSLSSYPDVKHYCNNSVIIEHKARMQNSSITKKSVLFNLQYVNSGKIIGSNTLNNIFHINNVKEKDDQNHRITVVSGTSVKNHFYFIGSSYRAKLLFSNNSENTIYMEYSKAYSHVSNLTCANGSVIILRKVYKNGKLISNKPVYSKVADPKDKLIIQYKGIPKERDDIHCDYEAHNAKGNSNKCGYIDTGGGATDGIDLIINCKKAIIRPYTSYSSKADSSSRKTSDTRYFNIKTDGYESDKNSFANISLSSTDMAYITLSDISVLSDTKEVIYMPQNKVLSMKFLLSKGGIFTLFLEPYVTSKFDIQDKDGKIALALNSSNITYVDTFALRTKIDNYIDVDQIKEKYVRKDDRGYKVFYTIESSNGTYLIGSTTRNVLKIGNNTRYVFVGEEIDMYSTDDQWPRRGIIDNQSKDKMTDFLAITFDISDIKIYRDLNERGGKNFNDLVLQNTVQRELIITNYFRGKEYQHLIVIDRNNKSYIPLHTDSGCSFIPFYSSLIDPSGEFDTPSNVSVFAVEGQKENIKYYTKHLNLTVVVCNSTKHEIEVTIKDYYSSNHSVKIFLYNDGGFYSHNYVTLDTLEVDYHNLTNYDKFLAIVATDYDNLVNLNTSNIDDTTDSLDEVDRDSSIDTHHTNFIKDASITYNHEVKNGILTPVSDTEQKLCVLWIHDVNPQEITVKQKHDDLILSARNQLQKSHKYSSTLPPELAHNVSIIIKNHFVDAKYSIDMLHFDFTDCDPIQIYTFNNTADAIVRKLSYASGIFIINSTSIKVKDLRCAYSRYNMLLKVNDIHKVLGFESLEDMVAFSSACVFNKRLLSKLTKNLAVFKHYTVFKRYNEMLSDSMQLQNYNTTYVEELKRVLKDYFLPTNITDFIEYSIKAKAKDDSISRPDSNSDTKVRYGRSVHFNDEDISQYNMQNDLNSAMQDSSAQMSSSASKPESWFASVNQKIVIFFKSVTTVGQQFWGSSNRLDLDTTINTNSIDQVLLNDYALIADSNTGNNAEALPILEYVDINNILHLGIILCAKYQSLQDPYISPQKALEIQRNMVLQETLQNLEQAMNRWDNNTYEENF